MKNLVLIIGLAHCISLAAQQQKVNANQPEIAVYVDGVLLQGTSTSNKLVATYSTGPNSYVEVSIRNIGRANLILRNWIIPSGFSAPALGTKTIRPGQRLNVYVYLDRSSNGVKSGDFRFTSNDSNESLITIKLRGKVLPPIQYTSGIPAESLQVINIYESRSGTNYSVDISNGPTPYNGYFVLSNNRGYRWPLDGSLRTVILHAGPGVTIENWTEGYARPPINIIITSNATNAAENH
jgi:hypothetical protein